MWTVIKNNSNKYVRFRGLTYIHTCQSHVHTPPELDRHMSHKSLETSHIAGPNVPMLRRGVTNWNIHRPSRAGRFGRFWAFVRAKFSKMGNSLPLTPMNRPAKFDAANFILGWKIRNRTNTHTKHKHTSSKRYIHTLPIGMCG